jgi:putative exosortase-associated protein (TIGR04073 family)
MLCTHERPPRSHRSLSLNRPCLAIVAAATLLALLATASPASAYTAGDKAARGLGNMMAGVMAFPGEIHAHWKAHGPSEGLTTGVAMGMGMIVVREFLGPLELLTAPFPWPVPHFAPLVRPEYPWEYFKE